MDGQETPDAAKVPTPYRDGKALTMIIAPDRRRQKTIAIVVASMTAGVALWLAGGWAIERAGRDDPNTVRATPGYIAGQIRPSVLHGPGGDLAMPRPVRSVVHVWLQACTDCMPAFEAMRDLESNGGLGVRVPIINVAYGEAEEPWARRYGVSHNLVFDPGGANVVKPLGIGTFTTLVVDGDGVILHRDRPDKPGYRERVRAAVGAANLEPEPEPEAIPTAIPLEPTAPAPAFGAESVRRVVEQHRAQVKRLCWERAGDTQKAAETSVHVKLTIGPDGKVVSSSATGDDPAITKCVEGQAKMWVFPPTGSAGGTTVGIPFKFVRQ